MVDSAVGKSLFFYRLALVVRVVKDRTLKDRLTTEPLKDRANDRMDGSFPKVLSIICL